MPRKQSSKNIEHVTARIAFPRTMTKISLQTISTRIPNSGGKRIRTSLMTHFQSFPRRDHLL